MKHSAGVLSGYQNVGQEAGTLLLSDRGICNLGDATSHKKDDLVTIKSVLESKAMVIGKKCSKVCCFTVDQF